MLQILDGGLGMELVSRSKLPATALWSVQNLIEEPDQVTKLHGKFIRAGARIITMNSYALTPQRLARHQLENQFTSLQKKLGNALRKPEWRQKPKVSTMFASLHACPHWLPVPP